MIYYANLIKIFKIKNNNIIKFQSNKQIGS